MGAVRMRVQTADKNISIIQTTPVHVLTSVNMFKKEIHHRDFFLLQTIVCCEFEFSIHNIAFSSEKVI